MICLPRVVWSDGSILFKVQVDGEDQECELSRKLAFALAIDLLRALLFGEK